MLKNIIILITQFIRKNKENLLRLRRAWWYKTRWIIKFIFKIKILMLTALKLNLRISLKSFDSHFWIPAFFVLLRIIPITSELSYILLAGMHY